jgi:pimeloyl-ACP methyl ester carboxylesterase
MFSAPMSLAEPHLRFVLLLASLALAAAEEAAATILTDVPKRPDPQARYLIFLHGKIVEDEGAHPTHPDFGVYEYAAILDALAAHGLTVISEQRAAGTATDRYAERVVGQVRRLLDSGVAPRQVTVAGFSKGGAIAVLTAAQLPQESVNFVFLAACSEELLARQDVHVRGRILSIIEGSDTVGRSCAPLHRRAAPGTVFEEIRLETGARHGAFFQPRPAWIDPVARWAAGGTP